MSWLRARWAILTRFFLRIHGMLVLAVLSCVVITSACCHISMQSYYFQEASIDAMQCDLKQHLPTSIEPRRVFYIGKCTVPYQTILSRLILWQVEEKVRYVAVIDRSAKKT